jgi:hypothetical protein
MRARRCQNQTKSDKTRKLRSFEYNQQPRRVRVRCSKEPQGVSSSLIYVPHKQTSYGDGGGGELHAVSTLANLQSCVFMHRLASPPLLPRTLEIKPGIKVRPSSFSKMPNRLSSVRRYARGKRGTCGRPHGLRLDHCTSTGTPTKALLCL